MFKESWSYTKIDTYKTCPFKYFLQYIKKIDEPIENLTALHKGSFVHMLLENKINNEVDLEDKELRELMNKLAKDEITKILRSVKKFIEGPFWNSLNFKNAKAESWFFLNKKLEPCEKVDCFVQGKIDYYEKKEDYILLIDWKTGRKTNKELEQRKDDCLQLDLYALWMLQMFPEYEQVNAFLYYIENNANLEKIYCRSDIDDLKKKVAVKILDIRKQSEFNRNLGPLCDYCGYFSEFCNSK